MQALFKAWGHYDNTSCADKHINVFDLDCLDQFHQGLYKRYDAGDLIHKVESNLMILEQIAAEILRLAIVQLHHLPHDMRVDPYTMDINDTRDQLLAKSKGPNAIGVTESIAADLAKVWLTPVKTLENEYAR
jgi:hypothetical protein